MSCRKIKVGSGTPRASQVSQDATPIWRCASIWREFVGLVPLTPSYLVTQLMEQAAYVEYASSGTVRA